MLLKKYHDEKIYLAPEMQECMFGFCARNASITVCAQKPDNYCCIRSGRDRLVFCRDSKIIHGKVYNSSCKGKGTRNDPGFDPSCVSDCDFPGNLAGRQVFLCNTAQIKLTAIASCTRQE